MLEAEALNLVSFEGLTSEEKRFLKKYDSSLPPERISSLFAKKFKRRISKRTLKRWRSQERRKRNRTKDGREKRRSRKPVFFRN